LAAVCSAACPAGNDVRGFLEAAARQDYTAALKIILETSPFPGVCGRVCPAPCMSACNRALLDEAVNVREVERAVAESGAWPVVAQPQSLQKVAVIGSGPAGLSAAYHLAQSGHLVTVFEAASELGGVLRSGIPAYRLPRDVLDREIGFVRRQGVEMKTDHRMDSAALKLACRDFAAIFIATGLGELRDLDLGVSCSGAVIQGLEFLDRAHCDDVGLAGDSVVVVGGGNTALDAARSALRLGAQEVRVIYRRSRAEMPAITEEVEEALEEGVEIHELVAPLRLERGADGPILVCQRMVLGDTDESGRRRPLPFNGEDAVLTLRCDKVLLALGQSPDLSLFPDGAQVHECRVSANLGPALVFAGGDFATGDGTVAAAIGSGRLAAAQITFALAGVAQEEAKSRPLASPDVMALNRFPRVHQQKSVIVPAGERRSSFAEVRRGLVGHDGEDPVSGEATRCLSCGICNACETCVAYCPEGALQCDGEHACDFDYEYCKGCGLCAEECPRGAIVMDNDNKAVCT
jgi:NADPH-dependent glutamate synthase beta subunit-like oxidoreductase